MRALAISVSAAVFAAGCGALAVLAAPQTAGKQTSAKATVAKARVAKSTSAKSSGGKTSSAKSPAAKSTSKSAATKSGTHSSSATSSSQKSPSGKSGTRQAASHTAPQQPTADRYKEIQQALADRGYFAGPVDGAWGASSMDALKRFQHDQNLTEDGKVGSLSLIALGLGPKRVATSPVKPADAAKDSDVPAPDSKPPSEAAPQ